MFSHVLDENPYRLHKRRSPFWQTFFTSPTLAVLTKRDFFNSNACLQRLSSPCSSTYPFPFPSSEIILGLVRKPRSRSRDHTSKESMKHGFVFLEQAQLMYSEVCDLGSGGNTHGP